MKRFTLIAAALIVMSGNIAAQKRFVHKSRSSAGMQTAGSVLTTTKQTLGPVAAQAPAKVRRAAENQLFMPLHEDVFFYEGGWIDSGSTEYTYDENGNVLTNRYTTDDGTNLTIYEYDEENRWTSQIVYSYDEEDSLVSGSKKTRQYDSVVKNLVVESMEYTLSIGDDEEEQWTLVDNGSTWKRTVTRNEDGNVTEVSVATYYEGDFETTRTTTTTYGEDGKAVKWSHWEKISNGYELVWEEFYTLYDMKWQNTDGQIVTEDFNDFYAGNNRLTSATVGEGGYDHMIGEITASYEDSGDYTYTFAYLDANEVATDWDVTTVKYTDENGSMEELTVWYYDVNGDGQPSDDEQQESTKTLTTYDDHGEITAEKFYFDGVLGGGATYEITYGDYDYPEQWIMSEYDEDARRFLPFLKLVRSNFVDVKAATSVKGVSDVTTSGEQGVYGLNGVKVASQTEGLPAGLYIVKKDGTAKKVVVGK